MSRKLSHIGIAVENLGDAVEIFSTVLDCEPDAFDEVIDQKIKTAIFKTGQSRVELLEGTSPDSPISKFVARRGPGIHHIAIEVENLGAELARLKKAGIRLIDENPRIGAEGALIAFIHPKSTAGILMELQQKK
jgi:methylmalonyl-CoA/ethylmalonyl-CoA epimerase